jgi:O-antigen ligase
MSARVRSIAAIFYLGLCVLLGGASAAGAIANAVLQALALIIILALMWSRKARVPEEGRPLLWIGIAFVAWNLLTIVPLPPGLWGSLPYRGSIAEGLRMLQLDGVSLPLSLAPAATITSLLWLLPPLAAFLLVLSLPADRRSQVCTAILVLAVGSIMFGMFQLFSGSGSPPRLYAITNGDAPVGVFANINHQATLILCAMPCAAAMAAQFAAGSDRSKRSGGLIMAMAFALFLTAGIAIAGSLAGYGLYAPVALASLLIYRRATAGAIGLVWKAGLGALLAAFLGVALFGPVSQQSLTEKFGSAPSSRRVLAETTVEAVKDTFPVGTGLATFSNVYRRYEDPRQARREFANHAHNDYLEIALELGLAGLLLVLAFIFWWARRSLHVWRTDLRGMRIARAASLIVGVVLFHSIVDYPIRTSAIAAIFAAACAMLVPPRVSQGESGRVRPDSPGASKHLEATA